jgi:hypothetical protein
VQHKKIFRPVFCYFSAKLVAIRPPIFSGQQFFFAASFELFGRKFGHLATVPGPLFLLSALLARADSPDASG